MRTEKLGIFFVFTHASFFMTQLYQWPQLLERRAKLYTPYAYAVALLGVAVSARHARRESLPCALRLAQARRSCARAACGGCGTWGRMIYRLTAFSYGAFSVYENPWLVRAVLAALWTACARHPAHRAHRAHPLGLVVQGVQIPGSCVWCWPRSGPHRALFCAPRSQGSFCGVFTVGCAKPGSCAVCWPRCGRPLAAYRAHRANPVGHKCELVYMAEPRGLRLAHMLARGCRCGARRTETRQRRKAS